MEYIEAIEPAPAANVPHTDVLLSVPKVTLKISSSKVEVAPENGYAEAFVQETGPVGGVPVLTNITLPNGFGPLAFTFAASNSAPIQVTFGPGNWILEPYYTITNGAGTNLVTNWIPGSSGTWNGTASG
ncbi:MAG: hypothetical protein ACKOGD_06985, partial [Sphingomonadales bacterium]